MFYGIISSLLFLYSIISPNFHFKLPELTSLSAPVSQDSKAIIVVKYGGNAMTNPELQQAVMAQVAALHGDTCQIVLVHGGGPEINKLLELARIKSEFIDGHRKTTGESMYFVQLALRGEVNGTLVRLLNHINAPAVGLSGKDGGLVTAIKRYHLRNASAAGEAAEKVDIGYVGDVDTINPALLHTLLEQGFLPVLAPIAIGKDGHDYNINADIFAGVIAAALKADAYISLTNVDGLYRDFEDKSSRITETTRADLKSFIENSAEGGMLPKLESMLHALENGVAAAHIINGTRPGALQEQLAGGTRYGTKITA